MTGEYDDDRRALLAERHQADHDAGEIRTLEERFGPSSLGCHEALHVTGLILALMERELATHPAILLRSDWYARVRTAQSVLYGLYQEIGAAHLS